VVGDVTRVIRKYADEDEYRSTWLLYDSGGRVRSVVGETWNDDGLDWYTTNGSEYALTDETYTWADGQAYAESRGGDLAEAEEGLGYGWVHNTFDPGGDALTRYWVGAQQDAEGTEPDEQWYWVGPEYPVYGPWLPGQPDDGGAGSCPPTCLDHDVAALVYNYDAGTAGLLDGLDDIDEETQLQAIIQREIGDVCTDGVLDYTRTYAWEFRYDGPRQRYLRREVDPYDFVTISEEWSDYSGEWVYADFVLDSGVTGGAHSVRDYLGGEAHADSSTHGVWNGEAYYHGNQIGSTRVMTDAAPHVVRSYVYDAFGNVYDTSGTATTRYRYAGAWGYQSHDDFPFLHVGARYYDPETGRFLQRDPIGLDGGLNLYEYAGSTPTTIVDPKGLQRSPGTIMDDSGGGYGDECYHLSCQALWALGSCACAEEPGYPPSCARQNEEYRKSRREELRRKGKKPPNPPPRILTDPWGWIKDNFRPRPDRGPVQGPIPGLLACFVGETLVETQSGAIPIRDLGADARILSSHDGRRINGSATVLSKFAAWTQRVIHIELEDEVITCTAEHPLWVVGQGWVCAGELTAHCQLLTADGQPVAVINVVTELSPKPVRVYNLTVSGHHTYYVGRSRVLVHNKQ